MQLWALHVRAAAMTWVDVPANGFLMRILVVYRGAIIDREA